MTLSSLRAAKCRGLIRGAGGWHPPTTPPEGPVTHRVDGDDVFRTTPLPKTSSRPSHIVTQNLFPKVYLPAIMGAAVGVVYVVVFEQAPSIDIQFHCKHIGL